MARRLLAMRHTVRRNWREDPVMFMLNVQRRRGNRITTALWEGLNRQRSLPSHRLLSLSALLSGDQLTLRTRLIAEAENGVSARSAKTFADIALAGDLPDLASRFAASMPTSDPGAAITRAKLLWYAGEMSEAIEALGAGGDRAGRLRERYRAEAQVFDGWSPSISPQAGYRTEPGVVLHLVTNSLPYTESGYAQRTHSLLREQVAAGWQVHAATRLGYPQNIGAVGASDLDIIEGVKYHRLSAAGPQGNLRERQQQEAEQLLRLVLQIRPSVLHTTTHFVNALAVRAVASAVGIPWIYEVRGQLADTWASKRGPGALSSERYVSFQNREAEVASAADGIITLGEEMRRGLVKAGVGPEKITLAPNGVGEEFLEEPADSRTIRAELGLPVDDVHIGTVSSLVPYEGLDLLIDAFALVAQSHKKVKLLIVGDGESASGLRRRAAAVGLDPEAVLPGRVPRRDAHKYHQALDIFVVPRQDHQVTRSVTPLKPFEAMACARPVVATDLPALREIVRDEETGIIVPPARTEDLASALERLVIDAGLRHQFGTSGRRLVLADRTWGTSAAAGLAQYAKVAGRKRTAHE